MADQPKDDRILIVDDTPRNIQVLGTILKEQGYQINVAQNGLQALDVVQKVTPDIILLDVMMPELDGFETCQRLKADPATENIPVIFLTAKVETEDVIRGFELGAVDYVTKPFNPTELLARVDTHLTLYKLKRNLEQLVEDRTAELRAAHRKLQQQVRELEARDRLAALQMKSPSVDEAVEAIISAINAVICPTEAIVYHLSDDGTALEALGALSEGGKIRVGDTLGDTAAPPLGDSTPATTAYSEKRPVTEGDQVAVPILYNEDAMGVILVSGLESTASARGLTSQDLQDALWRLSSDSALVLNSATLSASLETGDIDVDALLNLESDV